MVKRNKKKPVGRKNTTIRAIPKPLYNKIVSIQVELTMIENKNRKPKKVTLLDAGLELVRRSK